MRKLIIAGTLLALTLFGVGYVLGQVRGPSASFAAGTSPNSSAGWGFPHSFGAYRAAGSVTTIPKHADGTVTAISGNTITIQADSNAGNANEYASVTTIELTGSTQYNGSGGKSAITVGSHIIAAGTVSSDGKTMTASQVWAGNAAGCPHGAPSSNTTPGGSSSPSA